MSEAYRAAYLAAEPGSNGDCIVLTCPEHAALPDDALRAEALAEALRADILDTAEPDAEKAFPRMTRAAFDAALTIGEWRD